MRFRTTTIVGVGDSGTVGVACNCSGTNSGRDFIAVYFGRLQKRSVLVGRKDRRAIDRMHDPGTINCDRGTVDCYRDRRAVDQQRLEELFQSAAASEDARLYRAGAAL